MNIFSLPTFATATLILILGIFVFLKNRNVLPNRLFFILTAEIFTWFFFASIAYNSASEFYANYFMKICYFGIVFIPTTIYYFIGIFLRTRISFTQIVFLYMVSGVFGIFTILTNFVVGGIKKYFWGYYPQAGILHPFFLIFLYALMILSMRLLLGSYFKKETLQARKNQIKYVLIAFFVLAFSTIDFVPNYGIPLYAFGYLPVALFVILIAYSTIRYRVLDISVAFTRTGIFIAVYSIVLGIPFALAFGWRQKLIGLIGDNWWLIPLISSTVLATAGPFIYLFIQKRAEEKLLREQKRYQATLRQASSGMGRIKNLKKLLGLIVHIVTRTVHLEHSAIYLFSEIEKKFFLEAVRNKSKATIHGAVEYTSPLVRYLHKLKEPIVYEEIKQRMQDYQDPELTKVEEYLRQLDAAVVVPSFVDEKLLAFIVLGAKKTGKLYSEDDLAVFVILANQMALSIESLKFYRDAQTAQEKLFQAEKLAYVGRLASSIVHEIRNPLTAIKAFSEHVPQKYNDSDFREKFSRLVPQEIERIERVLCQLLDLAKPRHLALRAINVINVIDGSLALLENNLKLKNITARVMRPPEAVIVRADEEQLKQVLMNLFLNAIQAMGDGGELTVDVRNKGMDSGVNADVRISNADNRRLKLGKNPDDSENNLRKSAFDSRKSALNNIIITIKDTGAGISEENLKKLFTPFHTTKKDGVGLGLMVTREIIEAHGGTIAVESRVGEGTAFFVSLPGVA